MRMPKFGGSKGVDMREYEKSAGGVLMPVGQLEIGGRFEVQHLRNGEVVGGSRVFGGGCGRLIVHAVSPEGSRQIVSSDDVS